MPLFRYFVSTFSVFSILSILFPFPPFCLFVSTFLYLVSLFLYFFPAFLFFYFGYYSLFFLNFFSIFSVFPYFLFFFLYFVAKILFSHVTTLFCYFLGSFHYYRDGHLFLDFLHIPDPKLSLETQTLRKASWFSHSYVIRTEIFSFLYFRIILTYEQLYSTSDQINLWFK